jgi:hypothetical protein
MKPGKVLSNEEFNFLNQNFKRSKRAIVLDVVLILSFNPFKSYSGIFLSTA